MTLEELFMGTRNKQYDYKRLVICRGCRADPTSEQCQSCGRCPPERRQVPQMHGPFMVGSKTLEVESREKCREDPVKLADLNVPVNSPDGTQMKKAYNMGSQTPGRIPGNVKFVVKRMAHEQYWSDKNDLYTVLKISAEEALFGFVVKLKVLGDESYVLLDRKGQTSQPGEVVKVVKRGR